MGGSSLFKIIFGEPGETALPGKSPIFVQVLVGMIMHAQTNKNLTLGEKKQTKKQTKINKNQKEEETLTMNEIIEKKYLKQEIRGIDELAHDFIGMVWNGDIINDITYFRMLLGFIPSDIYKILVDENRITYTPHRINLGNEVKEYDDYQDYEFDLMASAFNLFVQTPFAVYSRTQQCGGPFIRRFAELCGIKNSHVFEDLLLNSFGCPRACSGKNMDEQDFLSVITILKQKFGKKNLMRPKFYLTEFHNIVQTIKELDRCIFWDDCFRILEAIKCPDNSVALDIFVYSVNFNCESCGSWGEGKVTVDNIRRFMCLPFGSDYAAINFVVPLANIKDVMLYANFHRKNYFEDGHFTETAMQEIIDSVMDFCNAVDVLDSDSDEEPILLNEPPIRVLEKTELSSIDVPVLKEEPRPRKQKILGSKKFKKNLVKIKCKDHYYEPICYNRSMVSSRVMGLYDIMNSSKVPPGSGKIFETNDTLKIHIDEVLQYFESVDGVKLGSGSENSIGFPSTIKRENSISFVKPPVSFIDYEYDNEIDDIAKLADACIEHHVSHNRHHPDQYNKMAFSDTYECMIDLLMSACRCATSVSNAFNVMKTWIYDISEGFCVIKPKFKNLNPLAVLYFICQCNKRGLWWKNRKNIRIDRTDPLNADEMALDWYVASKEVFIEPKAIKKYQSLPKVRSYLLETRAHISAVNDELLKARIASNHDKDKLDTWMILPYVWKWFVPKVQPTNGEASETSQTAVEKSDTARSGIYGAFDRVYNVIVGKLGGLTSSVGGVFDQLVSVLSKMESLLDSIFSGFALVVQKITGVGSDASEFLYHIVQGLVGYALWVSTDSAVIKSLGAYLMMEAVGLGKVFERVGVFLNEWRSDSDSPIIPTNEDVKDEKTLLERLLTCFGEFNPSNVGFICACIIGSFCSYAAFKKSGYKVSDLGTKCIESFKNMGFVGAGLFGLERITKYFTGVFEYVTEVIARIKGVESDKALTKVDADSLRKQYTTISTKITFWISQAGINSLRTSTEKFEEAKVDAEQITSLSYKIMSLPPDPMITDIKVMVRADKRTVIEFLNLIYRIGCGTKFRNTPFHVQFYGNAGIGKSTLMRYIIEDIRKNCYPDFSSAGVMYSPNEEDRFWPGYCNQPILVVDEMYPKLDADVLIKWLTIISNVPLMLPMAELSEKIQFFDSEWIISGTNVPYPQASGVSCIQAVWRRRHILVETICDERVVDKSSGKFSMNLFKKHFPDKKIEEFPHLTFNLVKPVGTPGSEGTTLSGLYYAEGECLPNGIKMPTKNISYQQLMQNIYNRQAVLKAEEERLPRKDGYADWAMLDHYVEALRRDVNKHNRASKPFFDMYFPHKDLMVDLCSSDAEVHELPPIMVVDGQIRDEAEVLNEEAEEFERFKDTFINDPSKFVLDVEGEQYGIEFLESDINVKLRGKLQVTLPVSVMDGVKNLVTPEKYEWFHNKYGSKVEKIQGTGVKDKERVDAFLKRLQDLGRADEATIFYDSVYKEDSEPCGLVEVVDSKTFGYEYFIEDRDVYGEYSIEDCDLTPTQYYNTALTLGHVSKPKEMAIMNTFMFLTSKELETEMWKDFQGYKGNRKNTGMNAFILSDINYSYSKGWTYFYGESSRYFLVNRGFKGKSNSALNMTCDKAFNETVENFMRLTQQQRLYVKMVCDCKYRNNLSFWQSRTETKKIMRKMLLDRFVSNHDVLVKNVKSGLTIFKRMLYVLGVSSVLVWTFRKLGSLFTPSVSETSKVFFKQPKQLPKITPTAYSPETHENHKNMVKRNVFLVSYKGNTANALGIAGNCFLMNKHVIYDVIGGKQDHFELDFKRGYGPSSEWHTVQIFDNELYIIPGTDLVMISSGRVSSFRDIRNCFRSKTNTNDTPNLELFYRSSQCDNNSLVVGSGVRVYNFSRVNDVDNKTVKLNNVIYYKYVVPKGSSGGPLLVTTNEQQFIVGIQCYIDRYYSYACAIYQENIQSAIDALGIGVQNLGPHTANDEISPTSVIIDTNQALIGSIPKELVLGDYLKTSFQKTPIYKLVPRSKRMPAILNNCNSESPDHPLKFSVNKYGRDNMRPLNQEFLDLSVQGVASYYKNEIKKQDFPRLSLEESIRGIHMGELDPINVKTSPGIPYVYNRNLPGKKDYIRYDEQGNIEFLSDKIVEDFEELERSILQGILPPMTSYEFAKDELRPIEKVKAMKTRSIRVFPFTANLLYRKYNGSIDSAIQELADGDHPICVGINPDSRAWDRIYRNLRKVSDEGADFDVGGWDGRFTHQLKQAVNYFNALIEDSDDPNFVKENEIVRESLSQFVSHGYVQIMDTIFQPHRGLGSGFAGTTPDNSKAHLILIAYFVSYVVYLKTNVWLTFGELLEKGYIVVYIYNDDIVLSISKDFLPYCSYEDVKLMYEFYGWPITSAAKDGSMKPRPIDDLQFLKRKFKPYNTIFGTFFCGALDQDVIYDLLYWMRRTVNEEQQFIENIDSALEFAWAHGKKFYEDLLELVNDCLKKSLIKPIFKPWFVMNSMMTSRLLSA